MSGQIIIQVPAVFTALAAFLVTLRFYVRIQARVLGLDDWTMLFAVLIEILTRVFTSLSATYQNKTPPTPGDITQALKFNYAAIPTTIVVSILARLSITILLIRLFGVHLWFKRFMIAQFVVVCLLSFPFIGLTFAQKTPVQALWDMNIMVTKKLDPKIWLYWAIFTQTSYTISDLTFALIPTSIIWNLNMLLRRRIGLILLVGVSLLTFGLSILKTVYIALGFGGNLTGYNLTTILTLNLLEGDFVIILGCVLALRGGVNLPIPAFASSISSLFRKGGSKWSTERRESSEDRGPFYDLEMSTQKLGVVDQAGHCQPFINCVSDNKGDRKHLSPKAGITRTDQFTVLYGHNEPATAA
ncbi:hypothetical protein F4825DRAFT_427397 [Nemania diffusa]|nr:hypothetical protein F4825DRAFT_427397 [Nemania diffusa]